MVDPVNYLDSDSLYHLVTWFDFKDLNQMRGVCIRWKQFVDHSCNRAWFRFDYKRRKLRMSTGKKIHAKDNYDPRTCYFREVKYRIGNLQTRHKTYKRSGTCSNPDHMVHTGRDIVLLPRYIPTVDYRTKFMRDLVHRRGRNLSVMRRNAAQREQEMHRSYEIYCINVHSYNKCAKRYSLEKLMQERYGVLSTFGSADIQAMSF